MRTLILIFFVLLPFASCFSCCSVVNDSVVAYKTIANFEFKFDNKNPDSLGYYKNSDDASVGVSAVYLFNKKIFLVDAYHNSVKIVSSRSGKIEEVIDIASPLRNIGLKEVSIKNNCLLLTAEIDSLYQIDLEDKKIQSFYFRSEITKYKFSEDDTSVTLVLNESQQEDLSVVLQLLKVSGCKKFFHFSKTMTIKSYQQHFSYAYVRGKSFVLREANHKWYLHLEQGDYRIPNKIRPITDYTASNIDFDGSTLVYYQITDSKFILTIVEY